MALLYSTRNYVIIKSPKELKDAKQIPFCRHIIFEDADTIYIWSRLNGKWTKSGYTMFGAIKERDFETTGLKAYQAFYSYCGKAEVERMKTYLEPIPIWDSYEQLHYFNVDYVGQKIYQPIFEYDANSAFTYGVFQLDDRFAKLKEYYRKLYDLKLNSTNEITKSKYKNLQNYLIGYFARVKEFVALRSEIIHNCNNNIRKKIAEIFSKNGIAYISSTDSIVTESIGSKVMEKYVGTDAGQFKLKQTADRLFYNSSNCYQIGNKVVYSGVKYFSRKHTDFFSDTTASQDGTLIEGFDFDFETENENETKLCCVRRGTVTVTVYNSLKEVKDIIKYKLKQGV